MNVITNSLHKNHILIGCDKHYDNNINNLKHILSHDLDILL